MEEKTKTFPSRHTEISQRNGLVKKTHDWSFMVQFPELGSRLMLEWRSDMDAKITSVQLFPVTRKSKGNNTVTLVKVTFPRDTVMLLVKSELSFTPKLEY